MNGSTENDKEGEYTFVGPMGNSVIDLCCVPSHCLMYVNSFKVLSELYSDHMPIELGLKIGKVFTGSNTVSNILPKLIFTEKDRNCYKNKLKLEMEKHSDLPLESQNAVNCLVERIKKTAELGNKLHENKKMIVFKEVWYDYDCFKLGKKFLNY